VNEHGKKSFSAQVSKGVQLVPIFMTNLGSRTEKIVVPYYRGDPVDPRLPKQRAKAGFSQNNQAAQSITQASRSVTEMLACRAPVV